MMQRAAGNAYSRKWAGRIRTKQSKWLEENLHDMEEKVTSMLKIIENGGDSFVQRIEMYYKKRPELINHVEESYRAYRALAERYDYLSKDLQSANHTIATIFPEQVRLSMDDYDDEDENIPSTSTYPDDLNNATKPNIPKVPTMPKKGLQSLSALSSEKGQLNATAIPPSSSLTKDEAQEAIEKLQRKILALQNEKEFLQSVYERCYAKCLGIENQITDLEEKVTCLRNEFGIVNVTNDSAARILMASTAPKSCQETLVTLQQKIEKSAEEAKVGSQMIKEVHQKFTTLKSKIVSKQSGTQDPTSEQETEMERKDQNDKPWLRENIKNELGSDSRSSLTTAQLADRIDELVEKVVNLETEASSQGALVNRLRSETNGFDELVKTLEKDKETLMQNSEATNNKLKEQEDELRRLKNLNGSVNYQNINLKTHFMEASSNIDHLSKMLQTAKLDEEIEDQGNVQEVRDDLEAKNIAAVEEQVEPKATITEATEMENEKRNDHVPFCKKHLSPRHDKKAARKSLSEAESTDNELKEVGADEEGDQPKWRLPYKSNVEDREKFLLEEFSLVLQNCKEVKEKLVDVEKKNQDGFFELAMQIRELKNSLATRDEEIQSLRKMSSLQRTQDDIASNLTKDRYSHQVGSPESMTQTASIVDNLSSICSPQEPIFNAEHEQHQAEYRGRVAKTGIIKKYPAKETKRGMNAKSVDFPHPVSAVEEKIRSDIDELLEESLEFWLRFSISFHQIRKFQTSIQDLKVELSKLKDRRRQEGSGETQSLVSEARPIYKHLRETQTDLTLWLENNLVLKDELQRRFASLRNIQDEISRISSVNSRAEESEISEHQAARYQGELTNMKQESNKVAEELQTGLDRVKGLKDEVEKMLTNLDQELVISASQQRSSPRQARIPLRSFLYGVKLKRHKPQPQKPSMFSCANLSLQKQYSDMAEAGKPPP